MGYTFVLDGESLRWIACCTKCGGTQVVGPLGKKPKAPKHECVVPTTGDLQTLRDADGLTAVARVMGFPEELLP